jgi:acetylornithine deacetylase/succinyl-diaminopimelate desuccinylase-like protein
VFPISFVILISLGCTTAPESDPPIPASPDLGHRAAGLLEGAIRLRSVNPPGDERAVAELLVGALRVAGVEAKVIETPQGGSSRGRAAAWGRIEGRGDAPPLVLLSHLDVVPTEPDQWRHPPFAGLREEGFVIGRGAIDAKGVAVVHAMVMAEVVRRDIRLDRDLIFLATPDEESGGLDGAAFIARERRDLIDDAGYVLTEGGSVLVRDGRPVWQVSVTEKGPCWTRLIAEGTPGHSSLPRRDAAVPRLIAALERVRLLEYPIRVTPEVARMFDALAALAPADDREGYANLDETLANDPAFRSRFLARSHQAALVRNTLSITVLEGSVRTNVLPARALAHLDARLLPGESCEHFIDGLRRAIADPGVRVERLLSFPSRSSPVDTPLFRAIEATAAAVDRGALVVPRVGIGFTDAHYFRDLGMVVYGFVPRWLPPEESMRVHGPNERISVENLERGIETLIAILQRLDAETRTAD